ncbi:MULTISPECIES: DUF5960 family protein [Enterococcus]|uniref:Uncharacterized protein n=1 Tax=Enterococcus alishanensis TaxID=1303817 RepID=A0ABS6TD11_9ENTE|nr:DUF5960 family protein [Enterococcus alishanensis]MBV7390815.1 hypothetical protein [Enterococcus alishanensis]
MSMLSNDSVNKFYQTYDSLVGTNAALPLILSDITAKMDQEKRDYFTVHVDQQIIYFQFERRDGELIFTGTHG